IMGIGRAKKSIIMENVASFDTWVWHAFFGVAGSQNVLGQSLVFNDVLRGHSPQIMYQINNAVYFGGYYLADRIYPKWTTFVKTILNPQLENEKSFAAFQEGYKKDVEKCLGILQARWSIFRGVARMFDEE
ncbi:PREDICTED: putative nuclease HARBI1, partial [Prunus dulcis]